jgi:putative nucleotidyltransferase with HDIG domain
MSEFDDLARRKQERYSRRVAAFTIAIARAMGVPREQILVMARGAFLHDIGKTAIPDQILRKQGKLDDDEMAVMRQHCVHGYKMLQQIPFLAEACEIVHCHHERYDGSGYPQGLKGKKIPLGARIVAVANSLDAIISDLPFRPARSLAEARKQIQTWAGRQFDPEVVEVFLKMPEDIWEDLRKNIDGWITPPQ